MTTKESSPNKNDRRYVKTERAIRQALYDLAQEVPFNKISISSLARKADIDRKTFYLHYESTDALVDQLMSEQAELLVESVKAHLHDENVPLSSMLLDKLSEHFSLDLETMRNIMSKQTVDEQFHRIEKSLIPVFNESDMFGLRGKRELPEYWTSFIVGGILAVYRLWLFDESGTAIDEVAVLVSDAVRRLCANENSEE